MPSTSPINSFSGTHRTLTGMPSFGPIFTPEETWLLVDYLWTFVFDR